MIVAIIVPKDWLLAWQFVKRSSWHFDMMIASIPRATATAT